MAIEVMAALFALVGLTLVAGWLVSFRLWLTTRPNVSLGKMLVEGMAGLVVLMIVGISMEITSLIVYNDDFGPLTRTTGLIIIGLGAWLQALRFTFWWLGYKPNDRSD